MNKKELRKIYLEKRSNLDVSGIEKAFIQQIDQLNINLRNKVIHIFLPIESKFEINTYPIIEHLRSLGGKIVVPKADFSNNTMQSFEFSQHSETALNQYDIPEPIQGTSVKEDKIDIIFCPLLFIDSKGYRVGYGKGFYDKFISQCRADIIKIGLSVFSPGAPIDDINDLDIPMDICICPKETFEF